MPPGTASPVLSETGGDLGENGEVKIQLLYFDGCPHWTVLDKRLKESLDLLGDRSTIEYLRVDSPEDAERLQFPGSPTVRLNGKDPFESPTGAVGLSCRVYPTPEGSSGSPTRDQLVEALRSEAR